MKSLKRRSVAAALVLPFLLVPAAVPAAEEDRADVTKEKIERINVLMDLKASTVVQLDLAGAVDGAVTTTIPIDGVPRTLSLAPHSVRSDRYEVKAQLADGSYVPVGAPPARTLWGQVAELDGSLAGGSLLSDGLHARIILPDGRNIWVEPLAARLADAAVDDYVVYRGEDVIPSGGTCTVLPSPAAKQAGDLVFNTSGGGGLFIAELGIDADFEFFSSLGTVEGTVTQIESVINVMNVEYVRDVATTHQITTIIVRTAEPDPYSSTDAGTLLGQFRSEWRTAQAGVPRDVAQLFTGKNINGSVIGIAWLGSICSTNIGYSVVQSSCCGSLACATDLSAHELGHSWNADHCSCSGWTMNPSLTCANRFHGTFTIPDILVFRNSRTCLDVGQGVPCSSAQSPVAEAFVIPKNRYLSFSGGNPGQLTALRVTLVDLPPPYSAMNGLSMWLGVPQEISENAAKVNPADAPGFPTFSMATLDCNPVFEDWSSHGTIHVAHHLIVPNGVYHVQEIDPSCALSDESAYSAPLAVTTSSWGDVVGNCETMPCTPPDGTVDVPTDIVSILDKFTNQAGAPLKARVDLEPDTPDQQINITDVSQGFDAFRGLPYPFPPGPAPCS